MSLEFDSLRAKALAFLQERPPVDSLRDQEATLLIKEFVESQSLIQNVIQESKSLFDDAPIALMAIDKAGKILDVNDAFYRTFFLSKKMILSHQIQEYITPAFHPVFTAFFNLLQEKGVTAWIELKIKTGLKREAYVQLEASCRKDSPHYRLAFINLTHQKKLEEELRQRTEELNQNESRLRHLIESSPDVFFYQDVRTGRIIYISPQVERLFGVKTEAVLRMSREEIGLYFLGDYRGGLDSLILMLDRAEQAGKHSVEKIFQVRDQEKRKKWVRCSFAIIRDSQGVPVQLNGHFRDITARIEYEEELNQARERAQEEAFKNKLLLQNIQDATKMAHLSVFEYDLNGDYSVTGESPNWPSRDGKVIPPEEWIHPEDLSGHIKLWKQLLYGEVPFVRSSYRSLYQGQVRYFNMMARLRNPELGKESTALGVIQDVTEQVLSDQKLRDTQNLWRTVVNVAPFYFSVKDAHDNFRYVLANKALAELSGVSVEDVIGKNDFEFCPSKEDALNFNKADRAIVADGKERVILEKACDSKGQLHHIRTIKKIFVTSSGQTLILGAGVDLTELLETQKKVAENQLLLQTLFDNIPLGIMLKDADQDFRYIQVNPAYLRMFGKKEEEILGKNDREHDLINWDFDDLRRQDERILKTGESIHATEEVTLEGLGRIIYKKVKIPLSFNGRRLLLVCVENITQTHNLLENERITFNALEEVTRELDFDKSLNVVVNALIEQLDCDRVYVERYDSQKQELALYNRWNRQGIEPKSLSTKERQEFWNPFLPDLKEGKILSFPDVRQSALKNLNPKLGTLSIIMAPLFVDDQFRGAVLLAYTKNLRFFTDVDKSAVRSTANIISLALSRHYQLQAIKTSGREKRLILDNIPVPIWLYDKKGKIIRINKAVRNMLGLSEEEILHSPCHKLFCQMSSPPSNCPVRQVIATGRGTREDFSLRAHDYIVYAEPIKSEEGELEMIVECAIDVTTLNEKRRDIQLYLSQQETLNYCLEQSMLTNSSDEALKLILKAVSNYLKGSGYCVLRHDSVTNISTPVCEYLCRSHVPDSKPVLTGMQFSASDNEWLRKLMNHHSVKIPYFLVNPAAQEEMGTVAPVLRKYSVASIYILGIYSNEKLFGSVGVTFEDQPKVMTRQEMQFFKAAAHVVEIVLERFQNREKLLLAVEDAKAADKAKSFFIASVSHEIRTPLNAVIGFSELLQDAKLDEDTQKDYLKSISYSGNALLKIINDVLDLSKLQAGKMEIVTEKADLSSLCTEIAGIFLLQTRKKELYLNVETDPMPLLWVDKLRIRQILFNLIGNAVKFTAQGGITVEVSFTREEDKKGTLVLRVKDTGMGISKDDIAKLTQPFVQFSGIRGTHAANSGTGLGLAICNSMIQAMGGKMEVESQLGQGSTFSIYLYQVAYEEVTLEKPKEVFAGRTYEVKKGSCCLLVDDIQMNIKVLNAVFKKIGVQTLCVTSGAEALEILKKEKVDLVLTDLWMPKMSGEQLAKAIHRLPGYEELPVIAVTADVASHENFDMQPFAAILTKPITIEKLKNIIR